MNMEDIHKIEETIRVSYLIMFVCAGVLLLSGLVTCVRVSAEAGAFLLVDSIFTLVLALLIKYKISRLASTIYFIVFSLGKVLALTIGAFNPLIFIVSVVLVVVFYRGMAATYRLHSTLRETGMPII